MDIELNLLAEPGVDAQSLFNTSIGPGLMIELWFKLPTMENIVRTVLIKADGTVVVTDVPQDQTEVLVGNISAPHANHVEVKPGTWSQGVYTSPSVRMEPENWHS